MSDRIEKHIEIAAPVSRVWRALTNHKEFSAWFKTEIATPFEAGKTSVGAFTKAGCGHDLHVDFAVQSIEPERYFSYCWHPYAIQEGVDYSSETPTLVEFTLEPKGAGTLLKVAESGFENVPDYRRAEAFRMNTGGWAAQMENIKNYVCA
jgi:uncharacterized protein YndB with AHSA1/START domain